MRKYIEVTGKDEDEAVRAALAQLSLDRGEVSIEIMERAKSGFLGIGGCPAKVRVYYGPDEETPEEVKEEKAAKAEKPKAEKKAKEPKAEKKPKEPKAAKAPQETVSAIEADDAPVEEALGEEVHDPRSEEIRAFVAGLMEHLEVTAQVRVYLPEKGRYKVILDGENIGSVIGRRGETLDAIQQLTSYSVNRTGQRVRIQMDAENYRAKREKSLERLAKKVAMKVTKYRRSVTLEPMNAYERHVIHTALQNEPNVTTFSTGVDPNRRVIVAYDREKN